MCLDHSPERSQCAAHTDARKGSGRFDLTRRQLLQAGVSMGVGLLAAGLLPLAGCTPGGRGPTLTGAEEPVGALEKENLVVGYIPITCATPIIMGHPLGYYNKYGLNVSLKRFGSWVEIQDAFVAGSIDAAHLLAPIPLALSLGVNGQVVPTRLAAMENVNGQTITLAKKYDGRVHGPQEMRGLVLAVPYTYSVHNLLLRHYLMSGGVDPDRDAEIRVVPPPEMVPRMAAGEIDGFLSPDPFNQLAVYQEVGYIQLLTKDLWEKHPCCGFAIREEFAQKHPNTSRALLKAIVDATISSHDAANRANIATVISAKEYLNQPEEVVRAVLTGHFADGTGQIRVEPARIDFDAYPWKSHAVWILSQMIRWQQVGQAQTEGLDLKQVADRVFDPTPVREMLLELGEEAPVQDYKLEQIMGRTFDANDYRQWLERSP